MQCKLEDQINWESLGKGITLSLIKQAGVIEAQYASLYKKLTHIPRCFTDLKLWQIQLLTGDAHFYSEDAHELCLQDGIPLPIYALWSGNINLLKKILNDKKERKLLEECRKLSLVEVTIMSQDVEALKWLECYNKKLIHSALKDKLGIILEVAKTSFIEGLLWLCDFDIQSINNTELFNSLKENVLVTLLCYLEKNHQSKIANIEAWYYLPFYLVYNDNLKAMQWLIDNHSILLESQLTTKTNIVHFAAYSASFNMFELIATHKKELIPLVDDSKRNLAQYAFLSNKVENVLLALQLTQPTLFYALSMKCVPGIRFEFMYGRTFYAPDSSTLVRSAIELLKTNYKIEAIDFFDSNKKEIESKLSEQFSQEININQEFKKTWDFTLLLLLASTDHKSYLAGLLKDIIFTISTLSLSKVIPVRFANCGMSFFQPKIQTNTLNSPNQNSELSLGSELSS